MTPNEVQLLHAGRAGPGAESRSGGSRSVVALRGEHDCSTAADVNEWLSAVIERDRSDLVVDLSAVDFMDASTVGVLVRTRGHLARYDRTLVLLAPSTTTRRLLDICAMAGLIVDAAPIHGQRSSEPGDHDTDF